MRKNKRLIIKSITVAILIGLAVFFAHLVLTHVAFDKEKAVSRMNADWNEISLITDFLTQAEQSLVIFRKGDGVKEAYYELTDKEIFSENDTQVHNAAKHLVLRKKYKAITKYNNYISFLMWTWFTDAGKGIVYSIDGREPDVQYLTKLEPLDRPGWYYYESDFNKTGDGSLS